eukprot:TRINITY_DN13846_c0_g1_i1.p1 TRINITY_DN13846_c0_g1~~TRINITY_DN13846_c0_g1_i1.p1  ORF type:complete len:239 (-),score=20.08 TRINITY_DN13846_c0_g1_i1:5-721(-)
MTSVTEYVNALLNRKKISVSGLYGRITRGKIPEHFERLSTEHYKRLSWVVGPDALEKFLELTGYGILKEIGCKDEWIAARISEGMQFKLALFPEQPLTYIKLATWENVLFMVEKCFPEIPPGHFIKMHSHLDKLKTMPFLEIQKMAGFNFFQVKESGSSNPLFMTLKRFIECQVSLVDLRAFLYCEIGCSELFRGDGVGMTQDGKIAQAEYLTPTVPVSQLQGFVMVDLDLTPNMISV